MVARAMLSSGRMQMQPGILRSGARRRENFSLMARMPVPRTYHSIAALLPDATVLTGGGGLCWEPCDKISQWGRGQIILTCRCYSPPYLFNSDGRTLAKRPQILSASRTNLSLDATVTLVTDEEVVDFALLRYGSVTHSINTDQRRVVLDSKRMLWLW